MARFELIKVVAYSNKKDCDRIPIDLMEFKKLRDAINYMGSASLNPCYHAVHVSCFDNDWQMFRDIYPHDAHLFKDVKE